MERTITPEQGLTDLENVLQRETSAGWEFVFKLSAYVDAFGPSFYYHVAEHLNLAPKTLMNYVSLAKHPACKYAEDNGLTRYHMQKVLSMDSYEAEYWLNYAAANGLSADALAFVIKQEGSQRWEPKATGSATTNGSVTNAQTHHTPTQSATSPHTSSHDEDDEDTSMCEVYDYSQDDDDVPFTHVDVPVTDDDNPFDVAERIVNTRGVEFAKRVAEEIGRWWT